MESFNYFCGGVKSDYRKAFKYPSMHFSDKIYSNKKEASDFHGTVSFDPAKMLQQK